MGTRRAPPEPISKIMGMPLMSRISSHALIVPLLLAATSCTRVDRSTMNYDQCSAAQVCTVRGIAVARLVESAWMAEVQLADGRCVSVSLPDRLMSSLKHGGPRVMSITGEVFTDPPIDVVSVEVNGRRIGLGACGDFFVFVPD